MYLTSEDLKWRNLLVDIPHPQGQKLQPVSQKLLCLPSGFDVNYATVTVTQDKQTPLLYSLLLLLLISKVMHFSEHPRKKLSDVKIFLE